MNKWPRCPKCRSQNVEIMEISNASISWEPGDPYMDNGILEPGDPMYVEGHCQSCEHVWRMRGIVQIKEEWFEEE